MPVRRHHDLRDSAHVLIRDAWLEQIAHRVDEHELGRAPGERLGQFFGDEAQVEALLVGMALHAAKAFGKRLGVAVLASGADLGAAADGVPGGVGPFDVGVLDCRLQN